MLQKKLPIALLLFGFGLSAMFSSCKKEPISTEPVIKHLSDYESNDGAIQLNIQGGKVPYSAIWSNGSTDTSLINISAGTYTVTITDAAKQQLIDTILVEQPAYPVCIDAQGNNYMTRRFGKDTWMVENLRIPVSDSLGNQLSKSYQDNPEYSEVLGMLYNWETVMNGEKKEGVQGICPDGWHVPSDHEWTVLAKHLDSLQSIGQITSIKKEFNVQYAGFYNIDYFGMDESGSYWTSTRANDNAWKRHFNINFSTIYRYHENPSNYISVRCVKNK